MSVTLLLFIMHTSHYCSIMSLLAVVSITFALSLPCVSCIHTVSAAPCTIMHYGLASLKSHRCCPSIYCGLQHFFLGQKCHRFNREMNCFSSIWGSPDGGSKIQHGRPGPSWPSSLRLRPAMVRVLVRLGSTPLLTRLSFLLPATEVFSANRFFTYIYIIPFA